MYELTNHSQLHLIRLWEINSKMHSGKYTWLKTTKLEAHQLINTIKSTKLIVCLPSFNKYVYTILRLLWLHIPESNVQNKLSTVFEKL